MPEPYPQVRIAFQTDHLRNPIRPQSAAEFAAVVDEIVAIDDFNSSYATVYFSTTRGSEIMLGVGVFGRKHLGAILYQSDEEERYTKGERASQREVFYADFGNPRYFPQDSEIDLDRVKATLAALFELDGRLPDTVEWQSWVDTEH
ncbi:hypothetical protein GCM10009830_14820 [Glycomyces endophyticus]|uniref:Immunity protein Imm1 n=1 Tax=Glycomyces endophyticus TaxID=480996 RepID=A0ABN2GEJ8_9ACTN